eukprot:TRINITY_DN13306_c0_g1_i3.p1 TRINITY_DN13306_c0_g1~~TRINITY_DN13306_c0_g1_i3.p1  ORF type:complete len:502 (-),score=109.92 TRINITY_DN13306_c0_g1_i3:37-1542(-)
MALSSDEVNFLIYRYMLESGFQHSAFSFGSESMIAKSSINGESVPPGALITFIQKGLQYIEIESQVNQEDEKLSALRPTFTQNKEAAPGPSTHMEMEVDNQEPSPAAQQNSVGAQPTEPEQEPAPARVGVPFAKEEVLTLAGHTSEVFMCAWCPKSNNGSTLLASGSSDSTARIWDVSGTHAAEGKLSASTPIVLKHDAARNPADNQNQVTTLDWNGAGSMLATGSYDGQARIWNDQGVLLNTLAQHKGPIFSLKWNKTGDSLLSASVDKSAIVWDPMTGMVKQQFKFHTAPTLDVDWKDSSTFATCSTDDMIYVCKLGASQPLKKFEGHQDEVNAIKWCPRGQLLASCSDDSTAKIWSMSRDKCVHDLRAHTKAIYTIKWSPTGPGTANPNLPLVLASASFDALIKIWDVEYGKALHTLKRHQDSVYSVAFSPNGEWLASGSDDHCLHIWNVKDGSLVKTFAGTGGIFEVCWSGEGNQVAACFSNNSLCVFDMRKMGVQM